MGEKFKHGIVYKRAHTGAPSFHYVQYMDGHLRLNED